ncbi:hypothetical protein FUAX_34570 [Fulvitalea axinellae]|uniref:PPM-type phosphatase domain-containing protein n=1 Tax=Fulvitalea axinellae TaxID=1182444 RepID=A0AAU9DEU1_9BACT|nr:hypothetical protein FUAX_34570 [Fulvitalea axinellae]
MLPDKYIARISALLSLLAWLAMLFSNLVKVLGASTNAPTGFHSGLSDFFLFAFVVFTYVFFRYKVNSKSQVNIIDLLWRVFVTGLVVTIVSLVIRGVVFDLGSKRLAQNPFFVSIVYDINSGMIMGFLLSTFTVWKKLVLYQKTKMLVRIWYVFEYGLLLGLGFLVAGIHGGNWLFNGLLIVLVILALVLSANLKWVAYLNFKQKWRGILLILLSIIYQLFFWYSLNDFSSQYHLLQRTELMEQVTVLALFAFTFIYSVFSLLVILFNLPTTSVFEQKASEIFNFQRLSHTGNNGNSEDQIYDILLDGSIGAVLANAAWLDILNKDEELQRVKSQFINEKEIRLIRELIDDTRIRKSLDTDPNKRFRPGRYTASLPHNHYRSVLVFPMFIQDRKVATLYLLKDVREGFNKDMTEMVRTFANQACISVENFRLLQEALETERYKEEIKIAKRVQQRLLPDRLDTNDDVDITAFSKAATEVGGDYYDAFSIDKERMALVIADVSGKGISAAYHMAEMKGVFQTLAQQGLDPKSFLVQANRALSRCLDRKSFITASYFIADAEKKTLTFARAGHCPTLYYDSETGKSSLIKGKGLGLGIVRNNDYEKFVEVNEVRYKADDVLLLFTDGITEAQNDNKEQFGEDKLRAIVEQNAKSTPEEIRKAIIEAVYDFCGKRYLDDDYTTVLLKFKGVENDSARPARMANFQRFIS